MSKKYPYGEPATDKPPAAISYLGRIVRAMPLNTYVTSREVFDLAFEEHEDFRICIAILRIARVRGYIGNMLPERKIRQFCLTDKGVEVQRAIA